MVAHRLPVTILMADDDEDDRVMAREAFAEARLADDLRFVADGEELLEYLRRQGRYADPATSPTPGLILLDLNMPKKDGREALREMKADTALHRLPVVVLTTSQAEEDVCKSYELCAASYITKPASFEGLVHVIQALASYWLERVELPGRRGG